MEIEARKRNTGNTFSGTGGGADYYYHDHSFRRREKESGREAAAEAEAAARLAEAEAAKAAAEALVDEPFVNILDKNNYELAVTWDGDLKKVTLEEISQSIEEKTGVLESQGYSVSFLLYDLNTGSGISYHPDAEFYSA